MPLATLQTGTITLQGEFLWGSNYTFLAQVGELQAVYKPQRGTRPLWDFPPESLPHREVAAYLVSQALGWELVPPTVYRIDAPHGPGSLQLFIEHDPEVHFFTLLAKDRARLQPVVLFDYLINNADRKGGHLLVDPQHHIWSIDHGVCFHVEDKLRTVIWDFVDQPIPAALKQSLLKFSSLMNTDQGWRASLREHLSLPEIQALGKRAAWLSNLETFPPPPDDRRAHPWPLL